jgi:ribose-phosphate pyrophosphokinase
VRWIGLVVPYLAYMRQDTAFHPGEVISQRIISPLLAAPIDALWTVDPHLHRVAIPGRGRFPASGHGADRRAAAGGLDERRSPGCRADRAGPGVGQWVRGIAEPLRDGPGAWRRRPGWAIAKCDIRLPDIAVAGKRCVLIDDVASTARTLAGATEQLLQAGAAAVDVLVTHALFVGDAEETLRSAGADRLVSTNSIRTRATRWTSPRCWPRRSREELRRAQP